MKKTLLYLIVLAVMQISMYSQAGNFLGQISPDSLTGQGYTWSTPLIMDGNLYWAGQDQGLMAFDLEAGELMWFDTLNFRNGTYDSPVGYDGKVFIGKKDYFDLNNYALLALDAETGNVIWQKSGFMFYNNQSNKPIDPEANTIFAASTDSLFCFNIDDGSIVWQDSGEYKQLILDYENSTLYAARADSAKIEIINSATGLFTGGIILPDSNSFISSMAMAEYESNTYLITMPDRNWSIDTAYTYCFNLTNPEVVWESAIGYVGNSAGISIMDGMVFAGVEKIVADTTQFVCAFDLLTGEVKWEIPVGRSGATNTAYTVALDGKVYFESNFQDNDKVLCVDAAAGTEVWSGVPDEMPEYGFFTWGSPLIYNNTLYLATDAAGLYWFDAGTVEGEWTMICGNILGTNSYVEGLSTDINEESNNIVPTEYSLSQNYPNPFNPAAQIEYRIAEAGNVTLKVYNMLGQEVMTLVNEIQSPGNYKIKMDGSNLASGVYFYRLTSGNFTAVKKMMLLK